MRAPIFLSLLFLASLPAIGADEPDQAKWSAGLYGVSADDTLSSSRVVGVAFALDLQKNLSPSLFTHFRGGAELETGSSSSLFTDEFNPSSKIFLNDARLRWTIFSPLSISGGALRQNILASPLLINAGTFPAALLSLRTAGSRWYAEGHAQAAIPTGTGLTIKRTGKESTPLLFSQTALLGWKSQEDFFVEAKASHFDFRNLTRGMAQDSRFYGNTVDGLALASQYRYRFEGFLSGLSFSLPVLDSLALVGGGQYLQNTRAPEAQNKGRYAFAGVQWRTTSFKLRPVGEWYENEADSAPAFYTSRDFGHNNRRGYGANVLLTLVDPALEIQFRARDAKLIRDYPFQKNNFQYYELTIGLPYASI